MQQLIRATAVSEGVASLAKCLGEKVAVRVSKRWRCVPVRDQFLGLGDTVGEVGRREVKVSHSRVESIEGIRVFGR